MFLSIAKFRLERSSDGAPIRCKRSDYWTEYECGYSHIRAEGEQLGNEQKDFGATAAIIQDLYDGWDRLTGIWTVTEVQAANDKIYLRLWGAMSFMMILR